MCSWYLNGLSWSLFVAAHLYAGAAGTLVFVEHAQAYTSHTPVDRLTAETKVPRVLGAPPFLPPSLDGSPLGYVVGSKHVLALFVADAVNARWGARV